MKYAAFISYSHKPESQAHAESLERAIKRYAKPLLRLPLAVFRDERVLTPGDDLPEELRHALEASEYLLYVASKEAAESQWIAEELRIWCEELDRSDGLIIVHVADRIAVDENSRLIDWVTTNALPANIRPYISGLPLYVNLAWAQRSEQRDLNNPEYKKQINALVARIRGVQPGNMNDEEVLIHKRNIRLQRAAVSLLVTLTLVAGIAAYIATRARDDAVLARDAEAEQRQIADRNAREALQARDAEAAQRALADRNAEQATRRSASAVELHLRRRRARRAERRSIQQGV